MYLRQELLALKTQMDAALQAYAQLDRLQVELFRDCGSDDQATVIKKKMDSHKKELALRLTLAQQLVSGT